MLSQPQKTTRDRGLGQGLKNKTSSGRRESSESRDFLELCSYGVHRYLVIGSLTGRSVLPQGARKSSSFDPPNPKLSPAQALFYKLGPSAIDYAEPFKSALSVADSFGLTGASSVRPSAHFRARTPNMPIGPTDVLLHRPPSRHRHQAPLLLPAVGRRSLASADRHFLRRPFPTFSVYLE